MAVIIQIAGHDKSQVVDSDTRLRAHVLSMHRRGPAGNSVIELLGRVDISEFPIGPANYRIVSEEDTDLGFEFEAVVASLFIEEAIDPKDPARQIFVSTVEMTLSSPLRKTPPCHQSRGITR